MRTKLKTGAKDAAKQMDAKRLRKGCPRCGSYRTYSSDSDFICMACSYILVKTQ